MSDQLQLNLADKRPSTQLSVLPGTEWEHIFGMQAPGDDTDQALNRSNTAEEDS